MNPSRCVSERVGQRAEEPAPAPSRCWAPSLCPARPPFPARFSTRCSTRCSTRPLKLWLLWWIRVRSRGRSLLKAPLLFGATHRRYSSVLHIGATHEYFTSALLISTTHQGLSLADAHSGATGTTLPAGRLASCELPPPPPCGTERPRNRLRHARSHPRVTANSNDTANSNNTANSTNNINLTAPAAPAAPADQLTIRIRPGRGRTTSGCAPGIGTHPPTHGIRRTGPG